MGEASSGNDSGHTAHSGHTARRMAAAIFDLAPIGIEIYDAQGRLLEANAKCRELFGTADIVGIKGDNLFADPGLSPENRAALSRGSSVSYETPFDFDQAKAQRRCSTTKAGTLH